MQLNSLPQLPVAVNLAGSLQSLQGIFEGQRVDAIVIKAALAGQLATLQLTDRQLQIRAEMALQFGQRIVLERTSTEATTPLKIIPQTAPPVAITQGLQVGTQVVGEVVKLLAQQRLLVNLFGVLPANFPAQLEIDTRALTQNFRPGESITIQVLKLQPLSVAIRPPTQQVINDLTRQILPQILPQPARLAALQMPFNDARLQAIQKTIGLFLQVLTPPQNLQQAKQLQTVLQQSGVFLERQLMNQAPINQDLKANLLTLSNALQQIISQTPQGQNTLSQLPTEIRQMLAQWLSAPQQLSPLPAQIQTTLTSLGKTPTQLIMQVLLGQGSFANPTTPAQPLAAQAAQINTAAAMQFDTMELNRLRVLMREVESTVARLQLNQLTMLREPESAANQQVWLMDIPIKDKQQLQWMQLQIERRKASQTDSGEDQWQVTLKLETQTLGLIEAAISLQGVSVNVTLTADSAETANWLQADIQVLHDKLADLQLTVGQLNCRCAPVEWLTPEMTTTAENALVDIRV